MMKENKQIIFYIVIAFLFSFLWHLAWVFMHMHDSSYLWNNQIIINTNDGYFFGSGAQKALYGLHEANPLVPSIYERGLVFVTALLAKILPFSIDTLMLYMPAFFASLIVIPLILIGKLYNKVFWGFLSALLASITWSYYNRTLAGYYDTDMFALIMPFFILYFLIKAAKDFDFKANFYAAIFLAFYPFLYSSGRSVAYALVFIYVVFMLFKYKNQKELYKFFILVFISLIHFPFNDFIDTIIKLFFVINVYIYLQKKELTKKTALIFTIIVFMIFLFTSDAMILIYNKIHTYTYIGVTKDKIHFFDVYQTISEANHIPFLPDPHNPYASNVAYRTTGSVIGFFLFIIGYILLVVKKREFILALPLVALGLFAHWGGLRFTVYAVPIAALSIVYLFNYLLDFLTSNKKIKGIALTIFTTLLIYPNIKHILHYNPGPVFTHNELIDLEKLNKISKPSDYTLAWWDYGYPLWYYSDTITLIDGGKHHNDNFIVSKMFLSTSPLLSANLARISVEEYVKIIKFYKECKNRFLNEVPNELIRVTSLNEKYLQTPTDPIIDYILQINKPNQKDPNEFLAKLENSEIKLPKKTRDIYFYAPLKMISIFPTIAQFSNLDLTTGKKLRNIWFYPTYLRQKEGSLLIFQNGLGFDIQKGYLLYSQNKLPVKYFIMTQIQSNGDIKVEGQKYHENGDKVVLYIKNLERFIIMDEETFNSNYVQMFLLGNYDKNLFELVIKSPYSRVYKLKI